MLRLAAGQVESLWDEVLPVGVRELPEDLRQTDVLLSDPGLVAPIAGCWQAEAEASGRSAVGHGRPTIAMETYVPRFSSRPPRGLVGGVRFLCALG